MPNKDQLPKELNDATEEGYLAYIHKLIARNRMGIAFTDVKDEVEAWSEQTITAAREHGQGISVLTRREQLTKLIEIAGPALDIDDPALCLAVVNYSIVWRKDRLEEALRQADLLKPDDSRYRKDDKRGASQKTRKVDEGQTSRLQRLSDLPDLKSTEFNLRRVAKILEREDLSSADRKAIEGISQAGEWVVLNGPRLDSLIRSDHGATLPTAAQMANWTPETFFSWFKKEIEVTPRIDLIPLVKNWLKLQSGQHDYRDLTSDNALQLKRELAVSTMEVLNALGLKLICGAAGCGEESILGVLARKNSPSGQYYFGHPSTSPDKPRDRHATSVAFPSIKLTR